MENQGLNAISDFRLRFKLESLYNHLNPSLAIHYTIKPVIFGSIAAAKLGIPFINNITGLGTAFIRSNWITLLVQFLYKISQKKASLILFQNKDDMRLFEEKKLVSKSVPKKLIPGTGVDVQEFSPRPYSMADENTFILIARLIWDKGVGEFIEAAKEIKINVPLVVRLAGTNFKEGKKILDNSSLDIISASDLSDAAQKIVKEIK